jgi:glycosyltransferase involved in cell wall biosynthesis
LARSSAKLVITFRGSDLNWNPHLSIARNIAGKLLSLLSMRFAEANILVSKNMAPSFSKLCDNVIVIPTGIDTNIFFPMNVREVRKRLDWDERKIHLIFNAGNESKNKRIDLAEACQQVLLNEGWSIELHVMRGDVPPTDVPLWMNAADILLMLSDKEGSPTVVQEALACGTPIVSVLVGDVSERLHNVLNSRIVSRDIPAIVQAIKELKPYKHEKYSFAVDAIDFRQTCDRVRNVYQSLSS